MSISASGSLQMAWQHMPKSLQIIKIRANDTWMWHIAGHVDDTCNTKY